MQLAVEYDVIAGDLDTWRAAVSLLLQAGHTVQCVATGTVDQRVPPQLALGVPMHYTAGQPVRAYCAAHGMAIDWYLTRG